MVLRSAGGLTAVLALVGLLGGMGCATPRPAPLVPASQLLEKGGSTVDARTLVAGAPLTVIVFFSRDCHCFAQHGDRLRALYAAYGPRGVQLVAVDPEVRASPEADAAEGARRGYPFPILVDRGAKLADALGAEYATYSVIVDARGDVRYRGGIDSDKSHLRDDATPYLRDALDDLLAGHAPRRPEAKTLGCSLEKW